MFLAIDVPARLVQLALDPISLTLREFIARSPKTCLHPVNVRLLAGESGRFASCKFAGSYPVRNSPTLVLLTVVYTATALRRGVGRCESKTHEYSKTDR